MSSLVADTRMHCGLASLRNRFCDRSQHLLHLAYLRKSLSPHQFRTQLYHWVRNTGNNGLKPELGVDKSRLQDDGFHRVVVLRHSNSWFTFEGSVDSDVTIPLRL